MRDIGFGYDSGTAMLCVDSYENCVPCGRYYNPRDGEEKQFCGLMKLLTELDEACSGVDPPGSLTATVAGSRFRGRMYTEPPDKEIKDGKKATFLIKILFRQNASWQGSVAWLEGKREQSFRSALELLFLMDSVLSGKDAKAS